MTSKDYALGLAQFLCDNFGLIVAVEGYGTRWQIKYHHPDFDEQFPIMFIEGMSLKIPAGSPQLLVDTLLAMQPTVN
jgi:hypothetical protein